MRIAIRLPGRPARVRADDAAGGPWYRRHWPVAFLAGAVLFAGTAGAALGYFMQLDLPDVRALQDYNPPQMTRIIAADGAQVETFAEQRRLLIAFHEIPLVFRQALMAIEDTNFERHAGIDLKALLRAAWQDLRSLRKAQGASTLTQQLARNLFLHPQKTFRRKVQEALLALEIERHYTKDEIIRFYCNQIYTGHGRYGIEAASRFYFGKPARELDLPEAATLAGLLQRPEGLSPLRHPERSRARRDLVLDRMVDVGYLDPSAAAAAKAAPVATRMQSGTSDIAPYFVEEVRRWLQQRYGSTGLYTEGLEVRTRLDPRLQAFANRAVERGLRDLDKRQGWRGPDGRAPAGADVLTWEPGTWSADPAIGEVHDAVVTAVDDTGVHVRLGPWSGSLDAAAIAWTEVESPRALCAPGDLLRVRFEAVEDDGKARLALEQEPAVEAALVALDPASGAVRALVGGFDFERSEYDRATQAKRQTGSAFKPFVYAAALESGLTLADTLLDAPTVFLDPRKPDPYQPENYTDRYYGLLTLRTALEKSANVATVKLIDEVGYEAVLTVARRLGIDSPMYPFPSLALGAFETDLLELTSAYGTFANQGVWVEPHLVDSVRDRNGVLIEALEPRVREAVAPEIAYLMNHVLQGVIQHGTGRTARNLGPHLAGKTGTTDDSTDAWFIGYSRDLAVGVWVGFDDPRSLGAKETGARAALPIWRAFMSDALTLLPAEEFPQPGGIDFAAIDRDTGLRASRAAGCRDVFSEAFIRGTEPAGYCRVFEHEHRRLPYPFQRFPLTDRGDLRIPADDLHDLLGRERSVELVAAGRVLEARTAEGRVSIPLEILPAPLLRPGSPPTARRIPPFDETAWVGHDGRPAEVVWLEGRLNLRARR